MLKKLFISCVSAVAVATASPVIAESANGPQAWPSQITVGLVPTEGGVDIVKRFKKFFSAMESNLGVKVVPYSASDYAGVITAMEHKHIDFAYFGPKSYIEAASKANAEALAVELSAGGSQGYHGLIITNSGSDIKNLKQALHSNRSFAFTDPNSTSGCLVPNVLFHRDLQKAPESCFAKVSYSGSHGASILAVKNNEIDVAATNDLDLNRMYEKGALRPTDLRVLWTSELIPGSVFAGRRDLPASLRAAFTGVLMKMNSDTAMLKKLGNAGFQPTQDSNYDIIRYMKRLKDRLQRLTTK